MQRRTPALSRRVFRHGLLHSSARARASPLGGGGGNHPHSQTRRHIDSIVSAILAAARDPARLFPLYTLRAARSLSREPLALAGASPARLDLGGHCLCVVVVVRFLWQRKTTCLLLPESGIHGTGPAVEQHQRHHQPPDRHRTEIQNANNRPVRARQEITFTAKIMDARMDFTEANEGNEERTKAFKAFILPHTPHRAS